MLHKRILYNGSPWVVYRSWYGYDVLLFEGKAVAFLLERWAACPIIHL